MMARLRPVALCLLFGCSDMPGAGADRAEDMALPAEDLAEARCSGRPTAMAGTSAKMIMSGGRARTYRLHVPRGYDPTQPTPLLFLLHGFGGSGQGILSYTRMTAQADQKKLLVAAPDGIGSSWNAGRCCGQAVQQNIDDVGFVKDLLSALRRDLCIDDSRVFASGHSNGGFMSHRLGCELSEQIVGIAPVAGGVNVMRCAPVRPVSLLHMHAKDDLIVPYAGGGLASAEGAVKSWEGWAMRNGCTGMPEEIFRRGKALCQAYRGCAEGSAAALCSTDDGGHDWPGSPNGSQDLDGSAQLVDFLLAHPRR